MSAARTSAGPRRITRAIAGAALLLAASCGIVGVCEKTPDLTSGGARVTRDDAGAASTAAAPDAPQASWEARGPDGGEEAALVSTALVPGVAAYEKMNVFEKPDYASARIGYVLRGTAVLVRGPVNAGDCGDNGQKWFQLEQGGYVCAGKGLLIGSQLSSFLYAAPPPDLTSPVPYRYARVKRDRTPVYKHAPTRDDVHQVHDFLFPPPPEVDGGVAGSEAGADAGPAEPPVVDDLGDLGEGVAAAEPAVATAGPPPVGEGEPASPTAGEAEPSSTRVGEGESSPDVGAGDAGAEDAGMSDADRALLQHGPHNRLLSRVLMAGFTVALTATERIDDHTWYRTLDGGYIDGEDVAGIDVRADKIGIELDATTTLPVGFVVGRGARAYATNARGEIVGAGTLAKFASFPILEQVTRGERIFYRTGEGTYVAKQRGIVIVDKVDPPRAVGQWDKWIVVDLATQTLAAYEGTVPVFATLVSTGKEGYETPRGVFRILSKHVSNPMDDFTLGEPYAIDEVPYVMYFQQNVALHGAFWHRGFGAVRSHGCVNLSPLDAHWLFDWVHPFLPEGWHGVYATDTDPGTLVWVRKSS